MNPVLSAILIWAGAITLVCVANYIHHSRRKLVTKIEDFEETPSNYWDNSALYDDPFLN